MPKQIVKRLWRAAPPQVVRCGDDHQFRVLELARNECRIVGCPPANRQIIGVVGEVDVPVADVHVDLDFGKALPERGKHRQHPIVRVGRGQADAQASSGRRMLAADVPLGLYQQRKRCAALLEVRPAFIGQTDLARRAHEETNVEALFKA
ncbi:hypothetical protein D3C81_1508360 [compost metagenome]